jgi:hypothetical protein
MKRQMDASRRSCLRSEGYVTRPCFFKCEMEPAKNRPPKMPQDAFSVSGRYHVLRKSCHD